MTAIVRVGLGYDLHRLEKERKLILGGIEIESDKGLVGHSDGDVLLHAIIDAMLGGAGMGDIGEQFPDTDPAYKDIDSSQLVERTLLMLDERGFGCLNVDATLVIEKPKLSPYKEAMRERVAKLMNLHVEAVSIKAKTNEGVDAVGQGEAVACHAVVGLAVK